MFKLVTIDYLPKLLELKQESWYGTHTTPFLNLDDQYNWFNNLKTKVYIFEHQLKNVGIWKVDFEQPGIANVGWDIFSEYRGKGFGKLLVQQGVEFTNLKRLNAEILSTNLISQKCAISAGFQHEGIKREAIYRCGIRLDSFLYGWTK